MLNGDQKPEVPRVIFFGMQSSFSMLALMALLESGVEVEAVIVPAAAFPGAKHAAIQRKEPAHVGHGVLPLLNRNRAQRPALLEIAYKREIPVWEVYRLGDSETLRILAAYQPDMVCVACFSLFFPQALIALPSLGCLNVHPSLLPVNRGPEPLFWTMREGHKTTGVTIHLMNKKMDSGDVLAQESIEVPEGIRFVTLETWLAELGGKLLSRVVWDLYRGKVLAIPQDEEKSSIHSFPKDEDFVVQADEWDARHVYNFVRGLSNWRRPIEMYVGEKRLFVQDVLSYSYEAINVKANNDGMDEKMLTVVCKIGWVYVQLI